MDKLKDSELLDKLEVIIVENIRQLLKEVGKEITYEQARNIIGNIGTRIVYGKELADKLILKK